MSFAQYAVAIGESTYWHEFHCEFCIYQDNTAVILFHLVACQVMHYTKIEARLTRAINRGTFDTCYKSRHVVVDHEPLSMCTTLDHSTIFTTSIWIVLEIRHSEFFHGFNFIGNRFKLFKHLSVSLIIYLIPTQFSAGIKSRWNLIKSISRCRTLTHTPHMSFKFRFNPHDICIYVPTCMTLCSDVCACVYL